ncbi:FAD-binding protein [Pelagibacterium lentulum]|uniref:2-hydroxy-acid oxidase n=1 Tax=Pelagibacterium lentulum TaxID=2029865 RepID=A0A916R8X4_9HYPH|nr:FAD-binding protein [Pelagibacterium lentulum]GGA41857.1 2-hydroxy-acid oxidase [Pelagibacterium lentulum]
MTDFIPLSAPELAQYVRQASATGETLGVIGGGTRGLAPKDVSQIVSTSGLSGITFYEPSEMVIGARAGTPLTDVEQALADKGQMLAFEPMDHRPLMATRGQPTIGAVAACNISGPRRVSAGAARDHLIGIEMVNGRGEIIRSGGRVMKNVTGLDLVKLNAGAQGSLGILTEVIFKLMPIREQSLTLCWHGLDEADAIALMGEAMGTPFEIDAAAHIPDYGEEQGARTLLRLEGFAPSCTYRFKQLARLFSHHGQPEKIEGEKARALWRMVANAEPFTSPDFAHVLRVHIAVSKAPRLLEYASGWGVRTLIDWSGGLIWLGLEPDTDIAQWRQQIAALGGHARLVRSSQVPGPAFASPDEKIAGLMSGIKHAFDPAGIFNPGIL